MRSPCASQLQCLWWVCVLVNCLPTPTLAEFVLETTMPGSSFRTTICTCLSGDSRCPQVGVVGAGSIGIPVETYQSSDQTAIAKRHTELVDECITIAQELKNEYGGATTELTHCAGSAIDPSRLCACEDGDWMDFSYFGNYETIDFESSTVFTTAKGLMHMSKGFHADCSDDGLDCGSIACPTIGSGLYLLQRGSSCGFLDECSSHWACPSSKPSAVEFPACGGPPFSSWVDDDDGSYSCKLLPGIEPAVCDTVAVTKERSGSSEYSRVTGLHHALVLTTMATVLLVVEFFY